MHQPSDFQVFRTLDRTPNARLLRSSTLSDGLALAHWYRDEAEILGYSDPGHHTLSLYLQGGWQTFRRDRPGLYGGPDRFCVMPAEHHSDWAVTRGLGFMHLYISPERLAGDLEQPLELGSLAELAALSEYHFARMFRVSFGLPPHRYVLERRLARARDLLAYSAQSLQEVSLACGFASPSHFNRRFREAHGATPGQYRAALKAS
ncbi:AraC family transcriptional regulator [Pseudomonas aeruginosa]|nr:AraC family transcriptional regulator [Pseudomonas aeruginosa]